MKPGFRFAMAAYGVLALLAAFTLESLLRDAVWVLLAGLAVKTWIVRARERQS
jgi:hypothetical protein